MPNSLKCRLKKLVHKGLLSEKDLNRIIVVPYNATNGDMIKALFPNYYDIDLVEEYPSGNIYFNQDWWNTPYKLSELKGE